MSKQIPVDKIGEVIGPKGKRINEIIAATGAEIDIQDDGTVFLGSKEGDGAERAWEMIEQFVNPKMPEAGEEYEGTVVKTTTFGAFVNLTPGKDGLLHISKVGKGRIENVEDVLNMGDKVHVVVREVDRTGRVSLELTGPSLEELGGGTGGGEGGGGGERRERREGGGGRDRDRGGDRGRRDRGPRRPRGEHRPPRGDRPSEGSSEPQGGDGA